MLINMNNSYTHMSVNTSNNNNFVNVGRNIAKYIQADSTLLNSTNPLTNNN